MPPSGALMLALLGEPARRLADGLGARRLGVGHLREEVVDELELVVGVGRDDAGMGFAERLQGSADRGQTLGHDLDDDTPPIGRVARPSHVAGLLEAVDARA